ncbi:unnamed protein product [Amoebophrya sp. A25]|nr:unnamed protein product [Amoebophrya sp. A25]|eukprot:GSA25T00015462001.1
MIIAAGGQGGGRGNINKSIMIPSSVPGPGVNADPAIASRPWSLQTGGGVRKFGVDCAGPIRQVYTDSDHDQGLLKPDEKDLLKRGGCGQSFYQLNQDETGKPIEGEAPGATAKPTTLENTERKQPPSSSWTAQRITLVVLGSSVGVLGAGALCLFFFL